MITTICGQGIRVDRADPTILISPELLDEWRRGPVSHGASSISIDGDLVTIRALNGTVTYHIGEYQPTEQAYFAERVES